MTTNEKAIEEIEAIIEPRFRREASLWRDAFRRLRKNKAAMVGLVIVVILVFFAIFGDLIAPYKYYETNYSAVNQNPSWEHWMGTDELGRDLLSRMLVGARISISVGVIVQIIILFIGISIGAIAGFFGGKVDTILMRFTDVMYAFPDLLFVIILMTAFYGTPFSKFWDGMFLIFLAIGIASWPTMARLVRGQFLSLREKEFIEAARCVGVGNFRLITKHMLPNSIGPIIVAITLGIPSAIMTEAILSFIGIGVQPPMCSWGSLVQTGFTYVTAAPYQVIFPGLAIAITMMAFTFLGDGLRDALDPWMKKN